MNINRKNYESYFLDYFENSLLPEQVAELMVFLEENHDLKEEFESFDSVSLSPDDSITFDKKKQLAKSDYKPTAHIDAWNYEEMMVTHLEGDLTEPESDELKAFIKINPNAGLELNLFKKTRLTPDDIQFPDKPSLKKRGMFLLYRKQVIYSLVSAAAIILLLFGLFSILNRQTIIDADPAVKPMAEMPVKEIQPARSGEIKIDIQSRENFSEQEILFTENETALPKQNSKNLNPLVVSSLSPAIEIPGKENHSPAYILPSTTFDGVILAGNYGEVEKERSFAARFIGGLTRKLIGDPIPENKSFLEITIDGYNMMADREVELEKEYNEKGKVIAYSLNGENIALFRGRDAKE